MNASLLLSYVGKVLIRSDYISERSGPLSRYQKNLESFNSPTFHDLGFVFENILNVMKGSY